MNVRRCVALLTLGLPLAAWAASDPKGSSDVSWLGRYAGSSILTWQDRDFDEAEFLVRQPSAATRVDADWLKAEGHRTMTVYQAPRGRSSLEVMRNYEQRLKADGFTRAYGCEIDQCVPSGARIAMLAFEPAVANTFAFAAGYNAAPRYAVYRRTDGGAERIVALYVGEGSDGPRVAVHARERKAMETGKIVVPTAAEMRGTLTSSGHIALYGIYFDTGEATPKPDSGPTLAQIVALLKDDPSLRVVVVGHTDNQGDFAANVKLSERRAAAVVAALVSQGSIPPGRLTAFGAGMSAPAASNEDAAGRAKNRRVELVRR
jgi:outer membrane protein OmpA-like peptidoglycan-associated protein